MRLFDETPAADVAMTPPPRRKLGRTGPVWVIGGIVLVVIVGLVWLAISRLTGGSEDVPPTAAEPTVQQVEEASPTPEPATPTTEASARAHAGDVACSQQCQGRRNRRRGGHAARPIQI